MTKTTKPCRVLLAEDDALVRNLVKSQVEMTGHQVIGCAETGVQAVELVQSLSPDIVLMDIMMPDMDGIEATRQIQDRFPRPVILLSAHDDPELVSRAGDAGANAYLVKPPHTGELARTIAIAMARFADLMELRRLNAELRKAAAEIKTLRGILPICVTCKKIRDDHGYWHQVEVYIKEHSGADFSHGLCSDCLKKHYPDLPVRKPQTS